MHFPHNKTVLDFLTTASLLALACGISALLLPQTGNENNSALILVSSVVLISLITDGYIFGILASVISTICTNWLFMVPYGQFDFSLKGYPVAIISNLTAALVVCTLTSRIKVHAHQAEEREKQTKQLYELNSRLQKEKAEIELNSAKAEIRSNILMSVSHDLRTPLTAIAGSAAIIMSQNTEEFKEQNRQLLNGIKEQAEGMAIMIENILSLAKLGREPSQLTLRPEVPDEIIESCIVKVKKLFPDSVIQSMLDEEVVMIYAEPILIRQVLLNLVENAIRHSGSSEPITIKTAVQTGKLLFTVEDNGVGIPEYIIKQIESDKQVQVEQKNRKDTGMGIGLSACQSILKAHNSVLKARNKGNGGAEFSFRLDIVNGEEE